MNSNCAFLISISDSIVHNIRLCCSCCRILSNEKSCNLVIWCDIWYMKKSSSSVNSEVSELYTIAPACLLLSSSLHQHQHYSSPLTVQSQSESHDCRTTDVRSLQLQIKVGRFNFRLFHVSYALWHDTLTLFQPHTLPTLHSFNLTLFQSWHSSNFRSHTLPI